MDVTKHSITPPSSAYRWKNCTGSVELESKLPDRPDSQTAADGTLCHEVAERIIMSHLVPATYVPYDTVDPEIIHAAKKYAEYCIELFDTADITRPSHVGVEQVIFCGEDLWGTCDFFVYDAQQNVLYVVDLKYGYRIVDIAECYQMLCYAKGLAYELDLDKDARIVTTVVQPRAYHPDGPIRSWERRVFELEHIWGELAEASKVAAAFEGKCVAGKWCRDCSARGVCEANRAAGYEAAATAHEPSLLEIDDDYLPMELSRLENALELLTHRVDALREMGEHRVRSGRRIPGYQMTSGRGTTKWNGDYASVKRMGETLGVDLQQKKLITPKQALNAGLSKDMYDAMSTYVPGKMKFTRIDANAAKEIFRK